jgi:ABC-2 type transport system permease protein
VSAALAGLGPMTRKELLEAWRTYRLAVISGLFIVLGITSPLTAKYLPEIITTFAPPGFVVTLPPPTVSDVIDQFLKNLVQFGALAAILVTMGSVAVEKERGTAAFVLEKPVSRLAFLAAKVIAIGSLFAIAIGLGALSAWIYTAMLFEMPPILPWIGMAAVLWLSTMVYVAITFLGSVLTRSSLAAAGIAFGALIVLSLASVVPALSTWLPAGLTAVAKAVALGSGGAGLEPARTIVVALGIVVVALGASLLSFRRQEL